MSNILGKVTKLFISQLDTQNRVEQNSLKLDCGGVVGDKFYDKNIDRSVLLTSQDSYNLIKQNNIDIHSGDLGENILIDFDPYILDIDSKISIGDTILQITMECTICKSLKKIDKCVPKLMKTNRGMFAKVIKNGTVSIDDMIKKVD